MFPDNLKNNVLKLSALIMNSFISQVLASRKRGERRKRSHEELV